MLRNHILFATLTIGGPDERHIPSPNLEMDAKSGKTEYNIPIYDGSTIPSSVVCELNAEKWLHISTE